VERVLHSKTKLRAETKTNPKRLKNTGGEKRAKRGTVFDLDQQNGGKDREGAENEIITGQFQNCTGEKKTNTITASIKREKTWGCGSPGTRGATIGFQRLKGAIEKKLKNKRSCDKREITK